MMIGVKFLETCHR